MAEQLEDLERWIDEARRTLPQLYKRRDAMFSHAGKSHVQDQITLIERILETHDQLGQERLERAERRDLLDGIHHGIQHCAQHAIDIHDDAALQSCLHTLEDIEFRLSELRRTA